jgi:undecaprenyl diphosphate synthase
MSTINARRRWKERARHVAIIADGNGRWAHSRGLPAGVGHQAGADTLKARICDAVELGIEELTVYSFSTENWARPTDEVGGLLSMLADRIGNEIPALSRRGVRVRFIGRRAGLPQELTEQMSRAETLTASNQRLTLFIAINYGARAEILDAAKRFGGTTEEEFRRCLYAPEMHDPQLVIRTGGEQRLSNFLVWQLAYSELIIRDELWPDFTRQSLAETLTAFRERQREPARPTGAFAASSRAHERGAVSNDPPSMISPNDSTLPPTMAKRGSLGELSIARTDCE